VEGPVIVGVVPGEPALVAGVLPEGLHELHRLQRPLGIEDDLLAAGIGLGAAEAPEEGIGEGGWITEAVPQRLPDRLALGLELLAHLTPGVPGLGELRHADLGMP
jgi:hypothetical protein